MGRPGFHCYLVIGVLIVGLLPLRAASDDQQPSYESLQSTVAQGGIGVEECPELATAFGEWVARQREFETARVPLLASRELGEKIHGSCRQVIRDLEIATNQDEVALETLYRSELWHMINRALAALRYWQAWLDLSLAQHAQDSADRVTELSRARRGFEAASVRILYPGIVYGSWLGLAYVAQLAEDEVEMKRRLTLLKRALASDPDNPLHEIVDTELALMALRFDNTGPIDLVQGEPLTPATARLVEEQAFALLAQHRETGGGAINAAKLLTRLIREGFLDDRLFARILSYQEEVVGHDIGPLGLLVDAEFAFAYQQYNSNVLKFRRYLSSDATKYTLYIEVFRYHYAVSLYQIGLTRDAMAVIDKLLGKSDLAPDLERSVAKLHFIVADTMYQGQPSKARRQRLDRAAREFLLSAPTDPDVGSAHMALARIADNDNERMREIALAAADPRLEDSLRLIELQESLSQFRSAVTHADYARATTVAATALGHWRDLPAKQRESLDMQVLAVQLRSVLVEEALETLAIIDQLYVNPALNASQKRVLVWSRLRLIDLSQGAGGLREFVETVPPAGADPMLDEELYVLLREFESQGRYRELIGLCGLWLPQLSAAPKLQRQVWLLQINALRAQGQYSQALQAVQAMLANFPNSGDAWQQLALVSEETGDNFSAERALAHISTAEPKGSERWIEVSLHRLQLLLLAREAAARACDLYRNIRVYNHRLLESQRQLLDDLVRSDQCSG